MKDETSKKTRGVFEKISGSDVWWIQYFDSAGRRRREKVGRKSVAIKLVEKRRSDARAGVKMPELLRAAPVTFREIGERALAYSKAQKRSHRVDKTRMRTLNERFGERAAESITPDEIEQWLDSRTDWKTSTKNRHVALMKVTYRLAERAGKIKINPLRLVQQKAENNARIRWLTDKEEAALRAEILTGAPDRIVDFDVALNTGLRLSEQYGMSWDYVDFRNGVITIPRSKNGQVRHVPMNSRTRMILEALKEDTVTEKVFAPSSMFWFRAAVKRANLKDFHWHDCRHTFASRLVMAGVDLRTVQELLGHRSIVITMRYSHLAPEHQAAAVERLVKATATATATGVYGTTDEVHYA